MRIAYLDCVGGASGDMMLSALLDAGGSEETLTGVITRMGLSGCSIKVERVMQGVISALHVDVITPEKEVERHPADLLAIMESADLAESIKAQARAIITRLAEAESRIHDAPLETIHLHEVGGDDTLIDIVGTLVLLEELGIERVYSSPLPVARGFTQSMHGTIPLPAPAALMLMEGAALRFVDSVEAELVTPTGAALVTTLAEGYDGFPGMRLETVGIGAGRRKMPFPNILRVWIGETMAEDTALITETLTQLETNIDDLNPQVYEHVAHRLFEAGALDVTLTYIQMKKNRPGQLVSVLCRPVDVATMQSILFEEKITLGVRMTTCERVSLPREITTVETPYGEIHVKTARWGEIVRVMPEYDDCRKAAEKNGIPLVEVMAAATAGTPGPGKEDRIVTKNAKGKRERFVKSKDTDEHAHPHHHDHHDHDQPHNHPHDH